MVNEVANLFGGRPIAANREELARRAAASAQNTTRAGAPGGSDYMNFSGKRGAYTIGQDKRRIEPDELWLLNITSFEDGYVCWKGGKPASTRMANIYDGVPVIRPDEDELGPFDSKRGEGWYQAKGWVAKSLDEDQQGYFKINSTSGVAEMADLIAEVSRRLGTGQPCWPVFSYDCEEFEAQGYKNFKPIFKVYGWLNDECVALVADPDSDLDALIAQSAGSPRLGNKEIADKQAAEAEKTATKQEASAAKEPASTGRRRRRG